MSRLNKRFKNYSSWLNSDPQKEVIILFLLLALALIPRIVRLASVPPGLDGDEIFNAIDAMGLSRGNLQLYFEGNNGREAFFLYLMALSIKLFGQTVTAVRLPAVFLGTGSVLLAYGIGRLEFSRRLGLIAGILMAVSLWPIMQSRWGLRAVSLTFFTALTVYLFGRAIRADGRKILWWITAGAALGLTMYTYIPARVFPLVILGWFIWIAFTNRETWRRIWQKLTLSLLVALVIFAPFGLYMIQNPQKVNQRIATVSGVNAWEKALDGEPTALLETVSSVLLMFNFSGDTALRYHVDARPVFDPLIGIFFLFGLGATIWFAFSRGSGNRAAYGLLLLWLAAMLTPNAILGANTSFLRAAGAVVPSYIIVAVGLDTIYSWLQKKWPKQKKAWRIGLVALLAVGSLAILSDTWRAYFVKWPNETVVRDVYNASLAEVGAYLDQHPPLEAVDIFIAYDYVSDVTPRLFSFYSKEEVNWIENRSTFSWRPEKEESWYIIPENKPLVSDAMDKLAPISEVELINFANGDPAFSLNKVKTSLINWQPQHEADLTFIDGPQLIGFDLAEPLYRGESARLSLHWQIGASQQPLPNRLSYARVFLEDEQNNIWQQAESLLGYPEAGWQAGDRFIQYLDLDLPAGIPPGLVHLRFGLRDWQGSSYGVSGESELITEEFIAFSRPADSVAVDADTPVFGDRLALLDFAFSSLIAPGLPMDISLDWLALEDLASDYKVRFELIQPDVTQPFLSQESGLWPDRYPTSQWQQGEQVTTFHRFHIPLEIPTDVDPIFRLQLVPGDGETPVPLTQGDNTLSQMMLSLREHRFEVPVISQPIEAQFGDQIQLLGYDFNPGNNRPSGELNLILYWQALTTPDKSYTVFNHVIDGTGQIQGQFDSPPVADGWLTSTWLPGEIIIDRRTIPIRPGAIAGPHSLIIGLYDAQNGERLPVLLDGQPQPDDQLILQQITIVP